MKSSEFYICEHCGTSYRNKEDAYACEKWFNKRTEYLSVLKPYHWVNIYYGPNDTEYMAFVFKISESSNNSCLRKNIELYLSASNDIFSIGPGKEYIIKDVFSIEDAYEKFKIVPRFVVINPSSDYIDRIHSIYDRLNKDAIEWINSLSESEAKDILKMCCKQEIIHQFRYDITANPYINCTRELDFELM